MADKDEAKWNQASVRELRAFLAERGVPHDDCVEKRELVQRVLENVSKPMRGGRIVRESRAYGGLQCAVVRASTTTTPSHVCVISHGYGAGGDDLVPIGEQILALTDKPVVMVFPAAPIALPQGGRAWYPLDLQALVMRVMQGQVGQIMTECPPGLAEAREQLRHLVEELCAEHNMPLSRIVLGGFSQGATMSLDVALCLTENVAGLLLWSPPCVNIAEWARLAAKHAKLKVLHSHGMQDPLVPAMMANAIEKDVLKPYMDVDFISFPGGHTIPTQVLTKSLATLSDIVSA